MPSNYPRNRFGPSRPRPRRKSNTTLLNFFLIEETEIGHRVRGTSLDVDNLVVNPQAVVQICTEQDVLPLVHVCTILCTTIAVKHR
jgi:hypothetical protein